MIINKNEVKEIQKQSKDYLARQPTEISPDVHLGNQKNRELKHLGIEIFYKKGDPKICLSKSFLVP